MVQLNFNSDDHEPQQSFDPIPAGWYAMIIVDCEQRTTKSGSGAYLNLRLDVDENTHPDVGNRVVFDRLNLWNDNPQAVEIANRTLSSICKAIGIVALHDSDQLIGQRLAVKVSVRQATEQFDASNEVKGYDAVSNRIGGAAPPRPSAPGRQAAPTQPATPPWKRG